MSQHFQNLFLPGKETLEKKISCSCRSGLEPGSDALQITAFATEPMGLRQLWTANLALILLTAAVSIDYSERPCTWPSGISGESQQTLASVLTTARDHAHDYKVYTYCIILAN